MLQNHEHPNSTVCLRANPLQPPPPSPQLSRESRAIANPTRSTLLITSSRVLAPISLREQRSYKKTICLHLKRFTLQLSLCSVNPTRTEFQSLADPNPPISTHVTTRKTLHGRRGIDAGSRMRDLFKYPLSLSLAMDLQLFRKVGSDFSFSTHSFLFGRALISDDLHLRCNIYPGDF
jgi:hypothetical protein